MGNGLSPKQRSAVERVINRPELQPALFQRVTELKWFDAFEEAGFFSPELNPSPKDVGDGMYQIPSWPVAEYLVASAPHLSEECAGQYPIRYWKLMQEVTAYASEKGFGNYRTWWQFSKILPHLPLEVFEGGDLGIVGYWLEDRFERGLVGDQILDWLGDLLTRANPTSTDLAQELFDTAFYISVEDVNRPGGERKQARLRIQSYQLDEKIEPLAFKAGQLLKERIVLLFESRLLEILTVKDNDKWSSTWRPSIADDEQNHKIDEADNLILVAFRESLMGYLSEASSNDIERQVQKLLNSEFVTVQRVGICVAKGIADVLGNELLRKIVSPDHFTSNHRHELWHFLNKHYLRLEDSDRERVLATIEKISTVHDETGNIDKVGSAYNESIWLSAIKDLDSNAAEHYLACVELTGTEPEHPDFSSYMTSGAVVHEAPFSLVELVELSEDAKQLVLLLNTYEYQGFMNEPGLEGLVKLFGEFIYENPVWFRANTEVALELQPHYLNEIFNSLIRLWQEKNVLDWTELWPQILSFSELLVQRERFWSFPDEAPGRAFIGNKNWVIGSISRLIEAGSRSDEHAFDLSNADCARGVLEVILGKVEAAEFHETTNAVNLTINAPRGRTLEAYIVLALFHVRNSAAERHSEIWELYEPVFSTELMKADEANEYEFATLVANHLPQFSYLSRDWTLGNIQKIFDHSNTQKWLCAVQGFSYVGAFFPEVYQHFKRNEDFLRIAESERLEDRIKDRYTELTVIGYVRGVEDLKDEGNLISGIIERKSAKEIGHLIWYVWTFRQSKEHEVATRIRDLVYFAWPRILDSLDFEGLEDRKLASKLCHWATFVTELDQDRLEWLLKVAPYAQEDFNSDFLLEALAYLSGEFPEDAYKVWMAMLSNDLHDYPEKSIRTIFESLVRSGGPGPRRAKEIAGLYLSKGLQNPQIWLREILGAQ